MTRRSLLSLAAAAVPSFAGSPARDLAREPRLKAGARRSEQKGWIVVHLEGSPSEVGYQHGTLLANEIVDAHRAIALGLTHDAKHYAFYRGAAEKLFWPKVDEEYQQELRGMAEGLAARAVK